MAPPLPGSAIAAERKLMAAVGLVVQTPGEHRVVHFDGALVSLGRGGEGNGSSQDD